METRPLIVSSHQHPSLLSLPDLRDRWRELWGFEPHPRIGRALLEKSVVSKIRELEGKSLSQEQRCRLDRLVTAYRRNPRLFKRSHSDLKPGVRLIKTYRGEHHSVMVLADGYEYRDKHYASLSEIAGVITGTRWNGWIFFGLKKRGE